MMQSALSSDVGALHGVEEDIVPIAELSPMKAIANATNGIIYLRIFLAIRHNFSVLRTKVVNKIIPAKRNLSISRDVIGL